MTDPFRHAPSDDWVDAVRIFVTRRRSADTRALRAHTPTPIPPEMPQPEDLPDTEPPPEVRDPPPVLPPRPVRDPPAAPRSLL